jgi:predicted patatin/cPLA2 family phospholipase
MRALVISGGGSKGAFAGGMAEHFINDLGIDYDVFTGSSTGSLLIPLLASNNVKKAKEVYTSITEKDIFTLNPYKIVAKRGVVKIKMNHLNILRSFWRGNKTLGSSKRLRKSIGKFFTEVEFEWIKRSHRDVIVTVSNLSLNTVEYKALKDCEYEDFCDWIWASANFLPFMSLLTKNGMEYGDGGFGNNIPIQSAINAGATEIDVIVLDPIESVSNRMKSANAIDLLFNVFDFLLDQTTSSKLELSKLRSSINKVKINVYHTPSKLTENSLIFNQKRMQRWWMEGRAYARKVRSESTIIQPEK